MKNLMILIFMIGSLQVFAQDKILHRDMTLKLNEYVLPAQSTSPNKALVYFSNRDLVDKIDYQEVMVQFDSQTGILQIDLPTSGRNGKITSGEIALNSPKKCQSDAGEVTIQSGKLIVYTDRVPNRVLCSSLNGDWRMFFVTIYKPNN